MGNISLCGLIEILGPEYIVWDKAASIRFLKPGKGTVRAKFRIPEETIGWIRETLNTERKVEPVFFVQVVDDHNVVITEVEKTLFVRKKASVSPN